MDTLDYSYIVLNKSDLDTQFEVYKHILEIDGYVSPNTNPVDKNKPYWFYDTKTIKFRKCDKSSVNEKTDLICDNVAYFFKLINSTHPKKSIMIGSYKARIYKDYIEVGCQKVSKNQIKNILEIMNE